MPQDIEPVKKPFQLYLSPALRSRIEDAAKSDKRRLSPQIEVLIEEALDARAKAAN